MDWKEMLESIKDNLNEEEDVEILTPDEVAKIVELYQQYIEGASFLEAFGRGNKAKESYEGLSDEEKKRRSIVLRRVKQELDKVIPQINELRQRVRKIFYGQV